MLKDRKQDEGWKAYGIQMAVSFAHRVEGFHPVIGVQVQQEAFELGYLAVLRFLDLC